MHCAIGCTYLSKGSVCLLKRCEMGRIRPLTAQNAISGIDPSDASVRSEVKSLALEAANCRVCDDPAGPFQRSSSHPMSWAYWVCIRIGDELTRSTAASPILGYRLHYWHCQKKGSEELLVPRSCTPSAVSSPQGSTPLQWE